MTTSGLEVMKNGFVDGSGGFIKRDEDGKRRRLGRGRFVSLCFFTKNTL